MAPSETESCSLCQQASAFGKWGSTEELFTQHTAVNDWDSDQNDSSKIHSYRGPRPGALGLIHLCFLGTPHLPPCPCCSLTYSARLEEAHSDLEKPSVKPGMVQKAGLEGWAEGWKKQSLLIRISLFVQAVGLESMDSKGGSAGTWASLCSLVNDKLFLQQCWSVRAEADGYFHGLAH